MSKIRRFDRHMEIPRSWRTVQKPSMNVEQAKIVIWYGALALCAIISAALFILVRFGAFAR